MIILFPRFLQLPKAKRWLLLEATLGLGLARLAVLTLPFRWIMGGLGQQLGAAATTIQPTQLADVQDIAWAIRLVSRRTPWHSNCLAQALTGLVMLQRRGIAGTLYLGVLKGRDRHLAAHAWLHSNDMIVTGGSQLERYTVLAHFSQRG